MKKVLSLMLVLVCVVLMSTVAFAADKPTYAPDESDGTYSIGYADGTQGNYYALLVVEGVYEENETPVISEDTVLYIDQETADANGDVSFDGWLPKNEEPATVYLGGTGLDKPQLLGYLGQSTFVVAGTVTTDSGTTYEATITLTDEESNVFTATSVDGAYTIEVPEGTYTFNVNVKNHLSYTQNNFVVSADVTGKDVIVLGGDVNGDGVVNVEDLAKIIGNYREANEEFDINNETPIDILDLAIVIGNYRETAIAE